MAAKQMKVAQLARSGAKFELVERPIPNPGPGEVRVRVEACGICHSDMFVKDGLWPGIVYPRVPGHEVAGKIDQLGSGVETWSIGQRVGVGWHGGHCFRCEPCRRGEFILCRAGKISGISYDGGYAEYTIVPAEALAAIPDSLSYVDAAPVLCAGITVFNALRNSGARPGDVVAVQGLGGLGHLAVQYASKMGFHTVVIARRRDKEVLAKQLGAAQYIDSAAVDPAVELQKIGGAAVALATAPDSSAITSLVNVLGLNGKLVIVAAPAESITVSPIALITGRQSISGWPAGTAKDSEDALKFSALTGVRPMIEKFPLSKVEEAYQHMAGGKARFRVVLTMEH